jgi:hypothetical protein
MSSHPKMKYHSQYLPKRVRSKSDEDALGPDWVDAAAHVDKPDYPKIKHHRDFAPRIAKTPQEEASLGSEWVDSPAPQQEAPELPRSHASELSALQEKIKELEARLEKKSEPKLESKPESKPEEKSESKPESKSEPKSDEQAQVEFDSLESAQKPASLASKAAAALKSKK